MQDANLGTQCRRRGSTALAAAWMGDSGHLSIWDSKLTLVELGAVGFVTSGAPLKEIHRFGCSRTLTIPDDDQPSADSSVKKIYR